MPVLPGQLALTSPADGALAVAADIRNANTAIQTEANALLTILSGGTAGQVLTSGGGTTVAWGPTYGVYTPTWGSSGVAPVIGNSTVVARYVQIGKLVHAWGAITFGGTATFGTGNYTFALPVAPSGSLGAQVTIGTTQLFDSSATAKATTAVELNSGSLWWGIYPFAWPSGASTPISATTPWTWAVSDVISWNITYEAA